MANTIRTYTGDGVNTLFPIDFDLGYIRKEFVYVYTGELGDYETQLEYTWANTSQIELSEPIAVGTEFYIRRIVPRDIIVNKYEDRSILKERNLDNSHRQHVMIIQEIDDGFLTLNDIYRFKPDIEVDNLTVKETLTVEGETSLQETSLNGQKLRDVGTPETLTDGATKGYVDAFLAAIDNIQAIVPIYQRHVTDGINDVYPIPDKEGFLLGEASYMVFLDGVKQYPVIDYTVNEGQITLSEIPPAGVLLDVVFFEPSVVGTVINKTVSIEGQGVVPIDAPRVTGDGVTVDFSIPVSELTEAEDSSYNVFLDGVKQRSGVDYTITGAILTFVDAPTNGTHIDITFYEPNVFRSEDDWGSVANTTTEPEYDFGTL